MGNSLSLKHLYPFPKIPTLGEMEVGPLKIPFHFQI